MALLNKINSKVAEFKRDESGAFSMIWAVSATVFLGVMGAALDIALLSHANARAQAVADTTALSAAIYIRDNELIPTDRAKGLVGTYTAKELGYEFRNWVIDGGNGVSVNVVYNIESREAVVTTTGSTRPLFMQIFGHQELGFGAETVVKFEEKEPLDPASVVLVLDNSGSMHFDDNPIDLNGDTPDGTQPRIDGLKTSANAFMDLLDETVGPQDGNNGPRVLRTGMMAFSGDIIPSRTVPMQWGTVAESSINSMTPGGATNSAPPLVVADNWLNLNEPAIHQAENPDKTILKYLILMTDGRNTVGNPQWVARAGTENWRRFVTGRETPTGLSGDLPGSDPIPDTQLVSVGSCSGGSWRAKCYRNNKHKSTEGPFNSDPGSYQSTFTNRKGLTRRVWCVSEVLTPEVCTDDVFETTWSGFEYFVGETPPAGAWQEGEPDISSNIETRAQCDSLHESGVEVFSIAYSLAVGSYRTNAWGLQNFGNADRLVPTTLENSNDARAILQYCASKPENFITADNTEALEASFERIGNTIIKEIIRIES